jgi:hypothetical protein
MPRRPLLTLVCLLVISISTVGELRARQDVRRFQSSDVQIEYPDGWDQMAVPPTLVAFIDGPELSFTVTRTRFEFSQNFDKIFIEEEVRLISELYRDATGIGSQTVNLKGLGQALQVDFKRFGPAEGRNKPRLLRYRLYSIPIGRFVYRLFCVSRDDQFDSRHAATFNRMIGSLTIKPPQT